MKKSLRNATLFLIGTVVLTWMLYFPIPLLGWNPYAFPGMILLILGGSVPTWFALILVFCVYDQAQRKDYFTRLYQLRRIKPLWWLVTLLLFPAIAAASVGLSLLLGEALPQAQNLPAIIAQPFLFFPLIGLSFLSGPFSEELGWRGFALDPLLDRFGFTLSGVVLGAIWGVWHLPLFFMPQTWHGQIGFAFSGFWLFVLFSIGLSWIMSWVYVHNGRSILSALLLHLLSNFSGQLMEQTDSTFTVVRSVLVCAVGAGIAAYMLIARKDAPERLRALTERPA